VQRRDTNQIPIINEQGKQLDEIILKEKIIPIPAKRGGFSASGVYYKGAGIVYRNHLGYSGEEQTCRIIGKTGLIYEDLVLCNQSLVNRFGIFTFRHQPIFSDYEGGCGVKEEKFAAHQKIFLLNAVEEIVDIIPTGIENHSIYCYRLKKLKGNLDSTVALLKYVLENNWNTAWDKNLWEDIECFGYVRDVADWFQSEAYRHKLGTAFALLNSLYRADKSLYARFLLKTIGYYDFHKKMILIFSGKLVLKYCNDNQCKNYIGALYENNPKQEDLFRALYKELIAGKACCHLEDDKKWDWVRIYYKNVKEIQ